MTVKEERNYLREVLHKIDDYFIDNWICPPSDGDYRKAFDQLIQGAIDEHEYFTKGKQ